MSVLSAAADVLGCYSGSRRELTVTDLVTLLDMPKSNASRLLRAMKDAGFLDTVGTSKRYRPAFLMHQVGHVYRVAHSVVERAGAVVARISAETGHTGYVSALSGSEIVLVTAFPGHNALRVVTSIGERLAAHASSTGRALLARLPDSAVRALFPDGFEPPSANAPQTFDDLLKRLAAVRREGFAGAEDEAVRGVGSISVAVGDPATGDAVALCISFPAALVPEPERQALVQSLRLGAAEIAVLLKDPLFVAPEPLYEAAS